MQDEHCQRIYLATVFHNGRPYAEAVPDYPYILESYHYLGTSASKVDLLREYERKVFLDSGAFSAMTLGVEINIESYARFIKEHRDIVDVASVLDGIGDAQLTLDNQHRLEDLGVQVLPCFHFGEPLHYLEHYLEHYTHITLGGMVKQSHPALRAWLDVLWRDYLTDDSGWPRVRVHGFGLTAMALVRRYPWFSVDSSSWVQSGAFGHIVMINEKGNIVAVAMSQDSPHAHNMNQHFDNMPRIVQDGIRHYVAARGYDVEDLRVDSTQRKKFNALVYSELGTRPTFNYLQPGGGLFQ